MYNSCKATGLELDGLPAKFIIDRAESIVGPLAYIVNLSIRSGVFPDDLKRAKIVPIYKKKAKIEPGNQGCQLSRIWRDSHAFDLLLTHSRN